ncbi:MAG: bifunctional 4-hydroxy-2-oxoglutarate aldolase/2-dehydro-3-deoxy-phosphogluconate aldolase, partial [Verrucomicrobiae bacterium]|nr:bifunctional 4-hydroxy-2-oxoglutarate aldolase/2-dehydro-3-deoxy-phosphogluconate aldolase [Verrucomicrobiae bacterium]
MEPTNLTTRLAELGVVPVVAIDRADLALPLADALVAGGLPVVEITFRTTAAAEVIERLAHERPGLFVGAGTVITRDNLVAAVRAGARFCVAPGLNSEIVRTANDLGIPFIPGVATPTEVEEALGLGCKLLKFFPAEALGGIGMLEAIFAPYQHTGIRFVPTGGVGPTNLEQYLGSRAVVAVGGTWLAKREDIAAGAWGGIRQRCTAAWEVVRKVRNNP